MIVIIYKTFMVFLLIDNLTGHNYIIFSEIPHQVVLASVDHPVTIEVAIQPPSPLTMCFTK